MKMTILLGALLALPLAGCTQSNRPEGPDRRDGDPRMPPPRGEWRDDDRGPRGDREMPPPPRRPGPPPMGMRDGREGGRWDDRRGPGPGGPPMMGRGPGGPGGPGGPRMMGRGPTSRPSPDEVFDKMDANKDGSITREEFKKFHESMRKEMDERMRDRFGRDRGAPTTRPNN